MDRERELILGGLLAVLVGISILTLGEILGVVVFAITVAYVLYPLRSRLVDRGLSRRVASALSTSVAFLAVVALIAPVLYVANQRRDQLIGVIDQFPDDISVAIGGMEYTAETASLIETIEAVIQDVALRIAFAAPGLVLELAVFTLLLYGILLHPGSIRTAVYELAPPKYHDVVTRLHVRTRTTLYSIYILQAATAVATFAIALVVFIGLGYPAGLSLAVIAGILQFVPIVGPSVVILALAAYDLVLGNPTRAVVVTVIGLVFVGFVPDAIVRTRLAGWTGEIAVSLYFVGFVGGILTVGPLGIIVGPLVVALLVEVVAIISDRSGADQSTLAESTVDKSGQATGSDGESGGE